MHLERSMLRKHLYFFYLLPALCRFLRSSQSTNRRFRSFHRIMGIKSITHCYFHRCLLQQLHKICKKIMKIQYCHWVCFISEPDYPYLEALAPFQPIAMRAVHCAIDTSLNFTQANKLIRELKPLTLILPECYTQPPATHPNRTELVIEQVAK